MKNLLSLIAFLSCFFGFAQKEVNFSVKQIDSISKKYGRDVIAEGQTTTTNEEGTEIGKGGFSYKTFLYNPDYDIYEKLQKAEKKIFDLKKNQTLVKAIYQSVMHYADNSEEITAEFYYTHSALSFVKILEKTYKDNIILTSYTHEIKYNPDLQSTVAPEVNKWINEQNAIILEYHYKENVNTK